MNKRVRPIRDLRRDVPAHARAIVAARRCRVIRNHRFRTAVRLQEALCTVKHEMAAVALQRWVKALERRRAPNGDADRAHRAACETSRESREEPRGMLPPAKRGSAWSWRPTRFESRRGPGGAEFATRIRRERRDGPDAFPPTPPRTACRLVPSRPRVVERSVRGIATTPPAFSRTNASSARPRRDRWLHALDLDGASPVARASQQPSALDRRQARRGIVRRRRPHCAPAGRI